MCEHDFQFEKNWYLNYKFVGETLQIPVRCEKCGKEAYEVWLYSCLVDRDTGEMIY